MKRALTLLLIFCSGLVYTENTIIAIVNNDIISLKAIESKILNANASEYKVDIVNQRIDNILQLQKAKELNVEATQNDVNLTLLDIAKNNNITIEQLRSYPEFLSLKIEVSEKITILNLQRLITKDINISEEEILNTCNKEDNGKGIKQIKIAQIIISELSDQSDQEFVIKAFLKKLSEHISKGASFIAFAKLHSQHSSYLNGGETEWIEVDNPTVKMLDSLKENEVSKIYLTDFGFAIGIKLAERFVSSELKQCKEKLTYLNAEKFYSSWVKELRDKAYIKIYYDAL
jgi:peptidyl-prolyl cis-trans isomerase SurA|tara:strand:- start:412 stop:1275 length:864 start_codon:yes stop_codon:yes gene_type:complete